MIRSRSEVRTDYHDNMLGCSIAISYEAALSADAKMLVDYHIETMRKQLMSAITRLKLEQ